MAIRTGGRLEGRTRNGVPVYNVALPLLRNHRPDLPPYRIVDVSKLERQPGHEQVARERASYAQASSSPSRPPAGIVS